MKCEHPETRSKNLADGLCLYCELDKRNFVVGFAVEAAKFLGSEIGRSIVWNEAGANAAVAVADLVKAVEEYKKSQ